MKVRDLFFFDLIKDKKVFYSLICAGIIFTGCSGPSAPEASTEAPSPATSTTTEVQETTDPLQNKGIGPVSEVSIGHLDEELAVQGKMLFETYCTACHKFGQRYVGPDLQGVSERRSPEWVMNMILNPNEMVQKDPIAQELLAEYMAPMANQNLTHEEARAILEYFRQVDAQPSK